MSRPVQSLSVSLSVIAAFSLPGFSGHAVASPFADTVVSYSPGSGAAVGYDNPGVALGEPERFTGEGVFPGAVTMFNSPFGTDEIVSVGFGGELIVQFENPVTDDPANPFGIDLLVFGNSFLADAAFPMGIVGGLFGGTGQIDVSPDGINWTEVPGVHPDGMFPTEGWQDLTDPFSGTAGVVPSNFLKPVDPSLTIDDLDGLAYADVLAMYAGSGGGAGIDLAALGLNSIQFVRITQPLESGSVEIDAFADVAAVIPADLDGNGLVDFGDLVILLAAWGECDGGTSGCAGDIDADGDIDFEDLVALLAAFSA